MNSRDILVVIIICIAFCYCCFQVTSCEVHRHGTWAPFIMDPLPKNIKQITHPDREKE